MRSMSNVTRKSHDTDTDIVVEPSPVVYRQATRPEQQAGSK